MRKLLIGMMLAITLIVTGCSLSFQEQQPPATSTTSTTVAPSTTTTVSETPEQEVTESTTTTTEASPPPPVVTEEEDPEPPTAPEEIVPEDIFPMPGADGTGDPFADIFGFLEELCVETPELCELPLHGGLYGFPGYGFSGYGYPGYCYPDAYGYGYSYACDDMWGNPRWRCDGWGYCRETWFGWW